MALVGSTKTTTFKTNPANMKYSIVLILLLSVATPLAAQTPSTTVIQNVNVIDVRTGKVKPGMTVLIQNGLIADVAAGKKYKLPAGSVSIDGTGRYLMPGLADAHIHFFQSGGLYTRPDGINLTARVPYAQERAFTWNNTEDYFRRYLRLGITTVVDVGGPMSNFIIRDSTAKAVDVAPNVLVTGPLFSMVDRKVLEAGGAPIVKITSEKQADSLFAAMLPHKPDFIKVWYIASAKIPARQSFDLVKYIGNKTHAAGLKLAVHATQLETAQLAVEAGADILVHSVDDAVIPDDFARKLVAKKVTYIPTLIVSRGYMKTFARKLNHHQSDLKWANAQAYGSLSDLEVIPEVQLPPVVKMLSSRGIPKTPSDSLMALNLRKLSQAGVNIATGTDAGNIGTMHAASYIQELEAMQRAGLSNADIIRAATLQVANAFAKSFGAVEKGRQADLLLLQKNPLDDLQHLQSLEVVIKDGRVFQADTLLRESPEALVQRQVNAYNARNLDAFLDTYHDNIEIYGYDGSLQLKGKEAMRKSYAFFNTVSYLHCEIVKRIVRGNVVIDEERVRFNQRQMGAVAIYEVSEGKIRKVTFIP